MYLRLNQEYFCRQVKGTMSCTVNIFLYLVNQGSDVEDGV